MSNKLKTVVQVLGSHGHAGRGPMLLWFRARVGVEGSWGLVSQCPVQMAQFRSSETACVRAVEEDGLWTPCACLEWGTQAPVSETLVT